MSRQLSEIRSDGEDVSQRVRWFRRGLETGDPQACDTFAAQQL